MALIVKYKFQNVDANGNSVTLLPQFPSGVSYTKTDVVEGNITTRVIETDDLSKVTYIRFGCGVDSYTIGAWEYLTEILDINISYVNTFRRMFRGCKILNKIDVRNWDTSEVTNMVSMFDNCISLTQLDVSNFDTGKVESMGYMFNNCISLTQLDVSNFDTSDVTNMSSMFQNCSKLTQLDVSKWDTGNVTSMGSMFRECSQLTQLDLSNFDTSNVTSMAGMFNACSQLTQLDVSNFDTSKTTNMQSMFQNCSQLTQLNVSKWVASKVTNMSSMFQNCSQLTQLDLSNWYTSKTTNMQSMFQNCSQLTQLDLSNFDTSNVTSMAGMFNACSQLTQLDVSNFDTSNVTNMYSMFQNCSQLTQLDVSNFDTSNVTNMQSMFSSCNVKDVGLIYCSKDTIDKLANCITSLCNFYVTNKTYTSPNPLVKYVMYREDKKRILYYNDETQTWEKPILREWDSIEKHSDGKYYYHKRSGEVVLNGSGEWVLDITQENTCRYRISNKNIKNSAKLISDRFMFRGNLAQGDYEYIFMNAAKNLCININKSKLSSQDAQGFKTWLQANPVTVVYQLAEEKVYECTDLDLITYQNETSLMVEDGAIAPKTTLKLHQNIANIATILQEKVNVLENEIFVDGKIYKELDKVKKLEESTASTVTTESSFTTVTETSNGYFEDVKLEGKTFVNMLKTTSYILGVGALTEEDYTLSNSRNYIKYVKINSNKTPKWLYISCGKLPFDMLKPNTKYTIKLDKCVGVISVEFKRNDGIKAISDIGVFDANGCAVVTTTSELVDADQTLYLNVKSYMASEVEVSNVILLEGDHTQNPPEFFEGLKSVGQDVDEISVLSCNENLLNEFEFINIKNASIEDGKVVLDNTSLGTTRAGIGHKVYLEQGCNYIYSVANINDLSLFNTTVIVAPLDNVNGSLGQLSSDKVYTHTIASGYYYLRTTTVNTKNGKLSFNISFNKCDTPKPYQPHKQDKKPILYYNDETQAWEKPILREWDSIEKHSDGKYYYHKRSGEVVLDGSEDWACEPPMANTIYGICTVIGVKEYSEIRCDKFKDYNYSIYTDDIEGIYTAEHRIKLKISSSKLYSQDVQGYKAWLQANPVTVVYQLAEEKVYECINLDLITYENETNFIVNTGAITPKSTLKVMYNITNVVRELQQKVSNLENYIQHVMIDALNNALNE